MKTDTSERGLESLILVDMTASGWSRRDRDDYDREFAVDLPSSCASLKATQPQVTEC